MTRTYADAVRRRAERLPVELERWSESTGRFVHVSDEPSEKAAEQRLAMARARGDEAEYRMLVEHLNDAGTIRSSQHATPCARCAEQGTAL
jgi:hypothetical protein